MIYLFESTAIGLRSERERFDGFIDEDMYRGGTTRNLTHDLAVYGQNTCFIAPKLPFWNLYLQYQHTLYPDLNDHHLINQVHLAERFMKNVRGIIQSKEEYLFCGLDLETYKWLATQVRTLETKEFTVGEVLPIEALMADYFGGGEYRDAFVERLKSLCRTSIVTTLREMRSEFLYKLDSLPAYIKEHKDFGFVYESLTFDLPYLQDRYDLRAISALMGRFYQDYKAGYNASVADNLYLLSLFLNLLLDAEESGDYLKLVDDDLKRQFTVLFAHGEFAQKRNPYLVEYFYNLRRTGSDDLKLFVLR